MPAARPKHLPDEVNMYYILYACGCGCGCVQFGCTQWSEGGMHISGTIENQFTLPRSGRDAARFEEMPKML